LAQHSLICLNADCERKWEKGQNFNGRDAPSSAGHHDKTQTVSIRQEETRIKKMTTAVINVEDALKHRDIELRCVECGEPLEVHQQGQDQNGVVYAARFEHLKRNPKCSLSHKWVA
jgi:hypothetical protein